MVIRKTLTLVTSESNEREEGQIEIRVSTTGDPNADTHAEQIWRDIIETTLLRGQNRSLTVVKW